MTKDTPLRLRREPKNPHDKNAIAVQARFKLPFTLGLVRMWLTIGYVKRSAASRYAKQMDAGKKAFVRVENVWAPSDTDWPKVSITIEMRD